MCCVFYGKIFCVYVSVIDNVELICSLCVKRKFFKEYYMDDNGLFERIIYLFVYIRYYVIFILVLNFII